jgi:predicted HTH domain antitoxin
MPVTIELPEEIERQLQAEWENLPRRALEALAVEGYRTGALTRGQVGQLLGLSFWETEALLKERGADLQYTAEDLEQDQRTHEQFFKPE